MKLAVLSQTLIATSATAQITVHPTKQETLADRAEMICTAKAIDVATGAKDWTTTRAIFTGEVWVNLTPLFGGEHATIPAAKRDQGCACKRMENGWCANAMTGTAKFERGTTFVQHTPGC